VSEQLDLVRSIAGRFRELDFGTLRDALAEASDMEHLAGLVGPFGELMLEAIDPEVEIELHGVRITSMVGERFYGWDGWLEFWRAWTEPWEEYTVEFSDWSEVGDTVLVRLDIDTRGRGSGVEVRGDIDQGWTVRGGRVARLDMFASRRKALVALGQEAG
jgi:hypothetical protein